MFILERFCVHHNIAGSNTFKKMIGTFLKAFMPGIIKK